MSRRLHPLFTSLTSTLFLAAASQAQTGPWTDGEILVRTTLQPSGSSAIVRVIPETGATAVLTIPQYWGGWAGSMVFDSYRGGLLSNMSLAPDNTFFFRLWLVAHDGTSTAMPGFTGNLKALASAGDGRVFFIRHTGATQGPQTVEYFDANDAIQTLKQSDGVTPFQADVEHLLYHAPSNALIGSSSWAATNCSATGSSLYRFPLSADGLRVQGPVTCTSVPTTLLYAGEIMGLDDLPNGNVLVTTASGWLGSPHDRLLSLNPVTLALASWAQPVQYDVNGGIWSARLGKAVVHANSGSAWWEPDGLRTFTPGATNYGTHIPTSLPLPAGGGFSPYEFVAEVDLNGPACDGCMAQYGTGLAGKGGIVPALAGVGCPDIGQNFSLQIGNALGSTVGVLGLGTGASNLPLFGGTLLVLPIVATITFVTSGTPGQAGAGAATFPFVVNDPALVGASVWAQAAVLDADAAQGIALTNGLKIVFG